MRWSRIWVKSPVGRVSNQNTKSQDITYHVSHQWAIPYPAFDAPGLPVESSPTDSQDKQAGDKQKCQQESFTKVSGKEKKDRVRRVGNDCTQRSVGLSFRMEYVTRIGEVRRWVGGWGDGNCSSFGGEGGQGQLADNLERLRR